MNAGNESMAPKGACRDIEPRLAAYVDGEIEGVERSQLETHLERCPPCRGCVASQRAAHELLASRRPELRGCAPEALRHRCAAQRAFADGRARLRRVLMPVSLAATLIVAAGLFLMFGWGGSVETYAAQLADDHVRCFQLPPQPNAVDALALGRAWQAANGWPLRVAATWDAEDLHLLAVRRCGSSHGHVAHLLYRWRGEPLSVYVLNGAVEDAPDASRDFYAHDTVIALGEHAVLWANKGRTYAVVARGNTADVERVAAYVRRAIE